MDIFVLLALMASGVLVGWFVRNRAGLVQANRELIRWTLWGLLGAMGCKLAVHRAVFARDLTVCFLAIGSSAFLAALFFLGFYVYGRFRQWRAPVPTPGPSEELPSEVHGGHELGVVALNSACVAAGFLAFLWIPETIAARIPVEGIGEWTLRLLLIFIGIDLGVELHRLDLRKLPPLLLWVPFLTILFSLGTGALFSLFTRLSLREGVLLYSGLGWYSLTTALLSDRGLVLLGLLAFIHNVFRELFAILLAPLAARMNPYLPIYLGGATTMDATLPFVQRYCGREYTLLSFYSGLVCSLSVIPLVRFIAKG